MYLNFLNVKKEEDMLRKAVKYAVLRYKDLIIDGQLKEIENQLKPTTRFQSMASRSPCFFCPMQRKNADSFHSMLL